MVRVVMGMAGMFTFLRRFSSRLPTKIRLFTSKEASMIIFRIALILSATLFGMAIYQRTINMWAMKNIGDTFLRKEIGSRQILLGTFFREKSEQNFDGKFVIVHFLGDTRMEHPLYCHTMMANGKTMTTRAHVQRIHRGKRAANDICSWAGHLAECEVEVHTHRELRIGTTADPLESLLIHPEIPKHIRPKADLVVCMAPMYIYIEWEILLLGLETWLSMGAQKIIVPVQSASTTAYSILKKYQEKGYVEIREWPKWPTLSDVNPNGLVLSRGIEESHVNCLLHTKPWADLVVFTDIDDFYLPADPSNVIIGGTPALFKEIFDEHPQAGSLLLNIEIQFNFNFLQNTKFKQNCQVWRMKTRVVVNASRVDSVNMHETGIHRFGYVQVRVPCRKGHFYHFRHSHGTVPSPTEIDMTTLQSILNRSWKKRLFSSLNTIAASQLPPSSIESFEDFDKCMGAINAEHWTMKVSRCLTPHVCFSRLKRDVPCVAARADYAFHFSAISSSYIMTPKVCCL
ncbi:unnamed protein product, partial [Mesorhabditis belari]|uniref:Glycosyltransferase family 92 protein n=1 Tax=Mesorhabditis belari TaxID=2138241 RepID=A0AAF3E8T8_9BILA